MSEKKHLSLTKTILLCSSLFFVSACSETGLIKKDGITSISINDNLKHTQYWEKNDKWDFDSVTLTIHFDDDSTKEIPLNCKYVTYKCNPEFPTLTEPKMTSVTLYNVVYTDYKKEKHDVPDKTFSITTVSYPEGEIKYELNLPILFLAIAGVILSSVGLLYLYIFLMKKKGMKI